MQVQVLDLQVAHGLARFGRGAGHVRKQHRVLPLDSLRSPPLGVRSGSGINIRPMCAIQDSFKHRIALPRRATLASAAN